MVAQDSGWQVYVKNYNDSPLRFSRGTYTGSVREDCELGTVVAQLVIRQDETQLNVEYYITHGNEG